MARVALDNILLGLHGELQPGDEIPATWQDLDGTVHDTDFARLEELGLVGDGKSVEPDQAPTEEPEPELPSDGLDDLGVRDLRKLAKDRQVDLGKAKKKADVIAALRAAQ